MILKRILAYLIDYMVILLYASILFLISYVVHLILDIPLKNQNPLIGNIISFTTLTIPVFLYFYFFEISYKQGTIGKVKLKLKIINNTKKNIFIRVLFKILPWEIAHIGVHWSIYYTTNNQEIPMWNWFINIFPQVLVLSYFISIMITKGKSSIYDNVANTEVILIK